MKKVTEEQAQFIAVWGLLFALPLLIYCVFAFIVPFIIRDVFYMHPELLCFPALYFLYKVYRRYKSLGE